MMMAPTETISNQSSIKGFDLSPYTPPDASTADEREEKDLNEGLPQNNMKFIEEENLLAYCSDGGGTAEELDEGLSKSQRLELYNQVALQDPESSDDEGDGMDDEEISATVENDAECSTDDASSQQEYKCLQEDEDEDDILRQDEKSESYLDSAFAASLVSNNFEQFDTNAFHSLTIEEEKINVIEQDTTEISFQSSEFEREESSSESFLKQKEHDPIHKFAKTIPLLKPPPPEKLKAYLKSQNKNC